MKTSLTLLAALLLAPSIFAQASLTPPPGPPVASMKTLDQIEPRIDMATLPSDANNRFVISQPGCYFLTSSITATGKNGIIIHVDDVSVDLGGFSLIGDGSANHAGIITSQSLKNIRIRNGIIRDFGSNGIFFSESRDTRFDDLTVSGNAFTGIYTGPEAVLTRCNLRGNGTWGVRASIKALISACHASENGNTGIYIGQGSRVSDSVAGQNAATGIVVGDGSIVTGCAADGNTGSGLSGGDRVVCSDCTSRSNSATGILFDQNAVVTGCVASLNQQSGIEIHDGVIKDCSSYQNSLHGIVITSGVVKDNHCGGNGTGAGITNGAGISAGGFCRVADNVCHGNDIGIASSGVVTGNVSTNNTGSGTPSANYHTSGATTNLGPVGNASTATSPHANFTTP